jgi:5-bromo-4-chloroindolyl phosphate hydrolysis protein
MIMYNYIFAWGAFIILVILLGLIVIRLGDIKDTLALIDFTQDKIHKYLFMIYMAKRIELKKQGVDLNQFCEDYCKKMTEEMESNEDFNPSEDYGAMSEMMNESYVDDDSTDDLDK